MVSTRGAMEPPGFRLNWLNKGIITAFVELLD